MRRVTGVVQHYDWGDQEFLPRFLGHSPDGRPWAELWLGTHPNGAARLDDGTPLQELTGDLPYLLKVLSAARPLSLQTHPDRARAERGFAEGRYPDPNPKPELLMALTPFEALCGVRPVDATLELLRALGITELADALGSDGVHGTIAALLHGHLDPGPAVLACAESTTPEAQLVTRLQREYPGEPSVVVTLLLNLVRLEPGESIQLAAGNLHAYVSGSGIELMGPSDNVVRAGLTSKPVDVDEVLAVLDPTPLEQPVVPAGDRYPLADAGVALVRVDGGTEHRSAGHELAIGLDGSAWYLAPDEAATFEATTYVVEHQSLSSANP